MSYRLKALLVAIQFSILLWVGIIYAGTSFYSFGTNDVDHIATASTH